MQMVINLAPVSLSNKKVNYYTCPRLTFLKKNATENAYKSIPEPLNFKIFWGTCPQTPLTAWAFGARNFSWNLPRLVLKSSYGPDIRQNFIAVLLGSLGYSSRQNLHTAKCELSSFVTVFSVLRFSCSFFSMNESWSATESQSTKQTEQATPAVHDKDDPWSKDLTNHAFNT